VDPEECKRLPINPPEIDSENANMQSLCYFTLAYILGDVSLCEKTIDYSDCVIRFSQERQDMTSCELLYGQEHEDLRDGGRGISAPLSYTNCVKFVISNDPSIENCNLLENTYGDFIYYRDECYLDYAYGSENPERCDLIETEEIKESCLVGFMTEDEIISKNLEIFEKCKTISDESKRNSCIHNIALALGDPTVCDEINILEKASFCKDLISSYRARGLPKLRYNPNFFEDTGLGEYA
jgi:hypothetical protein